MKHSHRKLQAVRLGVAVSLGILILAAWWASVTPAHTIAAPAESERDTRGLVGNGSVITIGVGAAMTGYPEGGWRQVNAVQLAVNQVNAAGGINVGGTVYTLALVTADDGCNATQAITAANTLLNTGAVAVVGYTCSGASNAAQPVHAASGVPMISPSSTGPFVTEQGYTTTFRVTSRDDSPSILLATYFRNWLKLDKAAIVEWQGFGGNWAADIFSNTFTSLGGMITSRRTVTFTADYTATLTTIKHEDAPNVIFYVDGDANQAGLFSHISHSPVGMTDVIIAWDSFTDDEAVLADYAVQAGVAAEGDHVAMHYRRIQDMPGYAAFNTAYQAAGFPNYGDEATATGAFAYDAANIILAAMEHAQSTSPAAIRDAIAATVNYQGVVGTYEGFDAKGDVIPQWAWLERYSNGQWVILHPNQVFLPITLKHLGPVQ